MKQQIQNVRSTIQPMQPGLGLPSDACYALIEIYFDDYWWHEASRNFHLTPGENRRRAEVWVGDELKKVQEIYDLTTTP